MKKLLSLLAIVLALPSVAFAAGNPAVDLLNTFGEFVNAVVPILIIIAIIVFFWGLIKFILNAGDSEGRKSGIQVMIWGVVALFVIVSVWGLVAFLQNTFGIDETAQSQQIPAIDVLTPTIP